MNLFVFKSTIAYKAISDKWIKFLLFAVSISLSQIESQSNELKNLGKWTSCWIIKNQIILSSNTLPHVLAYNLRALKSEKHLQHLYTICIYFKLLSEKHTWKFFPFAAHFHISLATCGIFFVQIHSWKFPLIFFSIYFPHNFAFNLHFIRKFFRTGIKFENH